MTTPSSGMSPPADFAVTLQTLRLPIARLRDLGYRVVIIPSDHQRAAIRAMEDVLAEIKKEGHGGP
jgi:2-methylisocitrate lyase-like PEP mutase family enzyme